MDLAALESFLRRNDEPLQYAAFFGVLAVMTALEMRTAKRSGRFRRWPANWGLTVLNIVLLGALPLSELAAADLAREKGWGLLNHPALPLGAALALGFVARGLVSYGIHVAMHKVPLLWRVHRVHHSDTALDVSTTVRFHPLEFAIQLPLALAALVLLGIHPIVVVAYGTFDAAMNVFTHADIRLPRRLDRALSVMFMTPNLHRVHHSAAQAETDSNYGAALSLWDRVFGTFRAADAPALAAMRIGLAEHSERDARNLLWQLWLPFRRETRAPQIRASAPRSEIDAARWMPKMKKIIDKKAS